MKKGNEVTIQVDKIKLTDITILRSSINCTDEYLINPYKPENININLVTEPTFDLSQNLGRFRLSINLTGQNNDNLSIGLTAEFMIDFIFIIENLSDFAFGSETGYEINSILGVTLLGICFSSARGIILERTKGTPFAGTILPVINPTEALRDSLKVTSPQHTSKAGGKISRKKMQRNN